MLPSIFSENLFDDFFNITWEQFKEAVAWCNG